MAQGELVVTRWDKKYKRKLDDVCDMLGLSKIHGCYPKTLRFCVMFTLINLPRMAKVIPNLSGDERVVLFNFIKAAKFSDKAAEK